MTNPIQQSQGKKEVNCLHDKYVTEESQGKMPAYFLLRKVSKCNDCGKDISHLNLLRI